MLVRKARLTDIAEVENVLTRAYSTLMGGFYDEHILDVALPYMTKANPELLQSGTYYVAEEAKRVIGCGGWTFEQPGSGKVEEGLVHLRHFATDPNKVRNGVGRCLFEHCATIAAECGALRFKAFSGLNAEAFYVSLGFRRVDLSAVLIGSNVKLPRC